MNRIAEVSVIGGLVLHPEDAVAAIPILSPRMFESPLRGRIYAMLLKAFEMRLPMDVTSIVKMAACDRYPAGVVEAEVLDDVREAELPVRIGVFAGNVAADWRSREARRILRESSVDPGSAAEDIRKAVESLMALMPEASAEGKSVARLAAEYRGGYFREPDAPLVRFGFGKIDRAVVGVEGGDMVVVAARPGVGKSAFALQVARGIARSGVKVGYFNLEMRERQIYERLAAAESGIDLRRLRSATGFGPGEEEAFAGGNARLEAEDGLEVHSGTMRVSEIRARALAGGYGAIVVDYLQLVRPDEARGANRYAEVGDVSRGLKAIAMDFNVPLIALSQLNRRSAGREDKEPSMSELRESGDIEQDASVILLLWDADPGKPDLKKLKVEKCRQGSRTTQELYFDGARMLFSEERPEPSFVQMDEDEDTPFT